MSEKEEQLLLIPKDQNERSQSIKSPLCFPVRYLMLALIWLVMFTLYAQRTNLSTAIVKISKEEHWDDSLKGIVLSSFFWGYITTQFPGGLLSNTFGAKPVLLIAGLGSSIFNAILPFVADNSELFIAVRVIQGVLQGALYPTAHSAITAWFPPEERSTVLGIAYSGSNLGTVVTMSVAPIIIDQMSWQFSFWVLSIVGAVWVILWLVFAASTPQDHHFISQEEVDHILASRSKQLEEGQNSLNGEITNSATHPLKLSEVPWGQIFTSPAMWAIIINNFTNNWGFYILLTWLPTYFTHELHIDMKKLGFVSPLPYVVSFLMTLIVGFVADWGKRKFAVVTVRKFFQISAQSISSIGLILLCFHPSTVLAVICMVVCVGGLSLNIGGMFSNHMDIAPKYAGTLMGLSNTAGTLPGIFGVSLTGIILNATDSWNLVFIITVAIYSFGSIVWLIFAKGHVVIK